MHNSESTSESTLAALYAHECELAELRVTLREMLGLVVCELRDPGGRVVTYGYHWQGPHASKVAASRLVIGYPTILTALVAGLLAGGAAGLIDDMAARAIVSVDEGWG